MATTPKHPIITDAWATRREAAKVKAASHALKTRKAQDVTVQTVVGVSMVAGEYTKTLVTSHIKG